MSGRWVTRGSRRVILVRLSIVCAILAWSTAASAATIAFYAPWDRRALTSLKAHGDQIDWLAPVWISVTGSDDRLDASDDAEVRAALKALRRRPQLLPVVANAKAGVWRGADAAALLADPNRRARFIAALERDLDAYGASGVVFDFEDLPPGALADYRALLNESRARFGPRGRRVEVTVPAANGDWDLAAFGRAADGVILMAYDEHWSTGPAGPIASSAWYAAALDRGLQAIAPGKLAIGLASYAYDWPVQPGAVAAALSIGEAADRAAANHATPAGDPASGDMHYSYAANGARHEVWFIDAETTRAEARAARDRGVPTLALWRLGTEDPAIWTWFGRDKP